MSHYQGDSGIGFGTILLVILFLLIVAIGLLLYTGTLTTERIGSWFGFMKTPESIQSQQLKPQEISQMVEIPTCSKQNIPVVSDENKPISMTQFGFDVVNSCCLLEYRGFLCGKSELSSLYVCQTSSINGKITYVRENNNFLQPELGITMINQLWKNQHIC